MNPDFKGLGAIPYGGPRHVQMVLFSLVPLSLRSISQGILCMHWEEWLRLKKEGWHPEQETHGLRHPMEVPKGTQQHFNVLWLALLVPDPQEQNSGLRSPKGL